jgi:drug/metabolite transporter (DMT)-like permease
MDKTITLTLLIVSAGFTVLLDYFAKKWSLERSGINLALTFVCSACITAFYMTALLREKLIIASFIWSLLAEFGFILLAIFVFHETLNTKQWVAVFLGFVSLILFII